MPGTRLAFSQDAFGIAITIAQAFRLEADLWVICRGQISTGTVAPPPPEYLGSSPIVSFTPPLPHVSGVETPCQPRELAGPQSQNE